MSDETLRLKADVDHINRLTGILANLSQRVTIPLGVTNDEWDDLLIEYLDTEFKDPKQRKYKQTNIPRNIWNSPDLTWGMFETAIKILKPCRSFLTVEVKRDSDEVPLSFEYNLLNTTKFESSGQVLRRNSTAKNLDKMVESKGILKGVASYPTLMLRDYLAERKLLWVEFDDAVAGYLKELPAEELEAVTRSKLRGDVIGSKISWKKLIKAFDILGADSVNFNLVIEMKTRSKKKKRIGDVSLLWRFNRGIKK